MATVETPRPEVRATAKYVRAAPRKAQLVAELIRGRTVPEARTILAFTTRDAARDVEKVLRSAAANAEANHGLVSDDLYVASAFVGAGPMLKRWRPRARGRVARIKKRTCHITIVLSGSSPAAAPPGGTEQRVGSTTRRSQRAPTGQQSAAEAAEPAAHEPKEE